jgi:hypothetical protein
MVEGRRLANDRNGWLLAAISGKRTLAVVWRIIEVIDQSETASQSL